MKKVKYSVIIPLKEINAYIRESIPIILDLDYKNFEIIILPNEISKIPEWLKNPKIKVIATGKVSPAIKRDIGAKNSNGEYLAFIDDDSYPKKDWLNIADREFEERKVSAIGGPAITPKNDSISQKASGLFFEAFLGSGGMSYRYKPAKKSFYIKDYPSVNLIVRKKAFFDVKGFDSSFWPGEDTKLCLDLIKKGHKIWYSNRLIVYHHRRKLFLEHLKQIGNYGKHRGYFVRVFPETSLKPVYFIPSLFLLGNVIFLVLSVFSALALKIWLALLAAYFFIALIDVFSRTKNISIGLLAVITIFLTHLTYGAMFLKGLFSRKFRSELR